MSRINARHIPTLGYPSQKAAIIALCFAGHRPKQIGLMVGTSINSVHRALSEYRRDTGNPTPVNKPNQPMFRDRSNVRPASVWDLDEDQRREAFARRAAKAAREARMAA